MTETTVLDAPDGPPLPPRIAALPRDERGVPIFWFVEKEHRPEIVGTIMDRAVRQGRCWLCGGQTGRYLCYTVTPHLALTRTSYAPPSHLDCCTFAARCMTRGVTKPVAVWTTQSYPVGRRTSERQFFVLGKPTAVEWWVNNRLATREEVLAGVNEAMPDLLSLVEKAGEEDRLDLLKAFKQVTDFMPLA